MMAGQTFVWGKDRATARALLDACDRLGIDQHVVQTQEEGFVVPDAVADEAQSEIAAGAAPPPGQEF